MKIETTSASPKPIEETAFEGAKPEKIRVLLVDDQQLVRQGLRMRLEIEPDIEVIGEAGDGREVPRAVLSLSPDVVLMDVAMPGVDGIAAAGSLGEANPRVAVVMLSLYDDADTRDRALAAGAFGFVGKHRPEGEMVEEIRRAARLSAAGPEREEP